MGAYHESQHVSHQILLTTQSLQKQSLFRHYVGIFCCCRKWGDSGEQGSGGWGGGGGRERVGEKWEETGTISCILRIFLCFLSAFYIH